jgi:hypothetical protein
MKQSRLGRSVMAAISGRNIEIKTFCAADVCLTDIAHSLSLQCRAGGHFERFYSVAQHSLNCEAEARERELSPLLRLACLLHDAGEAYLSDLIRPVKELLPDYAALERRIDRAVFSAFGLHALEQADWAVVQEIDDAMLYYEFLTLRSDVLLFEKAPPVRRRPDISAREPEEVRARFETVCIALAEQCKAPCPR